ncbi:TPA: hypothetical protein N0F65_007780, partial [Lagenidium giganteum]
KSHLLNEDQRVVYESVIEAVRDPDNNHRCFFLDDAGGTGKSFVLEQILARVRLYGRIAIPVASSGIAALLLTGSNVADLYHETSLIIWDEAAMAHRYALEAVDRSLRDIAGVDRPFGGIVMLLSGDFRQILPVVPRGSDGDVINACLKRSNLWRELKTLRLTINMRVRISSRASDAAGIEAFSTFLLKIGEGKHDPVSRLGLSYFQVSEEYVSPGDTSLLQALIQHVYSEVSDRYLNENYFVERAILTPITADVNVINDSVLHKLPSASSHSIDAVEEE